MDFKFIIKTPPDEKCIKNSHKVLAQALINKYGAGFIRQALEIINSKEN